MRKMLGGLAALGMLVLAGSWMLWQLDRFALPGFSARCYARLGDLSRRAGFVEAAGKLFQWADRAQERHLQWGVRSKRLARVMFTRPDLEDADQVGHQIFALAKQCGFVVFMVRPATNRAGRKAHEVFVEPSGEQQVRDFVESPELQASPFE